MSSITSGVGLVSGLPIQQLVDSLIAVQQKPITELQGRMQLLSARRTALLQISAQVLALKNSVGRLNDATLFQSAKTTSSDASAILATASVGATAGQYSFLVKNLATSHQLISGGFTTSDSSPVGAGTLTIETAAGLVNRSTELNKLNGGAGVQAGKIKITDREGKSAEINLLGAKTVRDVVEAINSQTDISIRASVKNDRLVLEDISSGSGSITVAEIGNSTTAADLGLLKSVAGPSLTGNQIIFLSADTRLLDLNDGNGVQTRNGLDDFEITAADGGPSIKVNLTEKLLSTTPIAALDGGTGLQLGRIRIKDRAGHTAEIDLSGATTVQGVLDAINNNGTAKVTAAIGGNGITLTDKSLATGQTALNALTVEDIDSTAADALGILGTGTANTITGKSIYFVSDIGDVVRLINSSAANNGRITAAISNDGLGLTITDNTTGGGSLAINALNDSKSAQDLGLTSPANGNVIQSSRLISGADTVLLRSLRGGRGVDLSELKIKDRAGTSPVSVDLSNAKTLTDVIDAINAAGTGVKAAISTSGLGITLTDSSGGTGNLTVSGVTADQLGINVDQAVSTQRGGNLQKQYVSTASALAELNNGAGVKAGKFRITDSKGQTAVVDLTQGNEKTIVDVIDEINSRPIGVKARINDTGDGLILEDSAGGADRLKVTEEGSTTARDLGILGTADEGKTFIDGSFEVRIQIDGNDSLKDVLGKITKSKARASASIINDGSGNRPYRLSLTSLQSGRIGELAIDQGTTGLSFDTLSRARDATVLFGQSDTTSPLVISSSSNTLTNVINGVRLDLISADDTPVTINVSQDVDAVVQQIQTFITNYNSVISTIDTLTKYDPDSQTRAILTGDSTASRVRQTITGLGIKTIPGLPIGANRLSSIGITLSGGTTLKLDEQKLRDALTNEPQSVTNLFANKETGADGVEKSTGIAGIFQTELDRLTDTDHGVISTEDQALQSTSDRLKTRIEQLQTLLERRRTRLQAQFQATERAIAQMQSQQTALSALSGSMPSANLGGLSG